MSSGELDSYQGTSPENILKAEGRKLTGYQIVIFPTSLFQLDDDAIWMSNFRVRTPTMLTQRCDKTFSGSTKNCKSPKSGNGGEFLGCPCAGHNKDT